MNGLFWFKDLVIVDNTVHFSELLHYISFIVSVPVLAKAVIDHCNAEPTKLEVLTFVPVPTTQVTNFF